MADASPALLPAIQDACLRCAEASLAKNNAPAAIALYDRLRTSQAPRHVRMAATRGAIIARGTAGVALLAEQLQSSDDGMFTVALQLANERPGPEVTKAVASALAGLSAEKQCLVLPALGQRRDHAALPAVLAAARNGPPNVRVAAISALTQIGDPGALPALTESATNPDQEVSTAARNSLASFPAREADAAIQAMLNAPNAKVRVVAAELTGQRRLTAAVPALLKAADDAEQPVRLASLKALGELAGPAELPALLSLLLNAKSLQDSHAAEGALAALCARQAAPAACAGKIVPGLGQARGATQVALLRVLRAVGGAEACAAVRAAADAGDAEVKETALRVLCDWPTPDALPDLTRMAKTSTDPKFKLLALRGCLRLIPLQDAPDDRKLASLQETLPLVERDEEKRLAIAALGQIAAADSLALLAPHFDNPNLKEEAGVAAVAVAEQIVASHPAAVVTAMQKAAAATSNTRLANRARALLRQARAAVAPQRKK
jgi:HEAT repeat protein